MDIEKLIKAWEAKTGARTGHGIDCYGESVELHRMRRALKVRMLRLRGVDDRRLRRWRKRYDAEYAARRQTAKTVCLGLGYGRGAQVYSTNTQKENELWS